MADNANILDIVRELQGKVAHLDERNKEICNENRTLRGEIEHIKTIINRQASYIAEIEGDLDNLGQYNRRENVVFTNLLVNAGQKPDKQIIDLCKEIEVDVTIADIVACHALPAKPGKPKRYIARFHERSTAQKIFRNRKKSKKISSEAKGRLASNAGKGFGIMPNLTIKRGKLFAQVSSFNEQYGHSGCWIDPNSGKILLKINGSERGRVISNTSDLVEIENSYSPKDWYFCSSPKFNVICDRTPPANNFGNANLSADFSPTTPFSSSPVTQGNLVTEFGYNTLTNRFDGGFESDPRTHSTRRGNAPNRRHVTRGNLNKSY